MVDKNHEITAYFNSQKSADKFDYIKDYYTVPNIKNVHFKEKNNVVLVMGESLESNFNFTEPRSKELDKIEQKENLSLNLLMLQAQAGQLELLQVGILDCL